MKKTLLFSLAAGALIAGATAATQIATRSGDVQQIEVTLSPASGTTVSAISEITIQIPASNDLYMEPNAARIGEIILTNDETDEVYKASEWGEAGQSEDEAYFNYPVKFATPITAEGTYTLSIPQGIIREMEIIGDNPEPKIGGAQSKATTATYTIAKGEVHSLLSNYALDPASGETVTEIEYIQILFKDLNYNSPLWNTDNEKGFTITNGETVYYGNGQIDMDYMEEEGLAFQLFFYADDEISGEKVTIDKAGTWTLHLGEGVFNLKGDLSPEITATYTIEGGEDPNVKTENFTKISPANGETVASISKIEFYSSFNCILSPVEDKISEITLTKKGSDTPIKPTGIGEFDTDGDSYVMFPIEFERITEAGEYTLNVPEGTFVEMNAEDMSIVAGGAVNAALTATYTIGADAPKSKFETYTFTPDPTTAVNNLGSAIISFPEFGLTAMVTHPEDAEAATVSNGTTTYTAEASPLWENEYKEYEFKFYDGEEAVRLTESGKWTLTIPAGYFEDASGNTNNEIKAVYTIDSSLTHEIKWTADPENGGTSEVTGYAQNVTFTFEGAEEVSYDPTDELAGLRITYNGEDLKAVDKVYGDDAEYGYQLYDNWGDNTVVIRLSPLVLATPGILKISIDEGRFTIDGEASPAIEYSCTFGDYKEFAYTLTPDGSEEVNSLAEFTLTFTNATTATIDETNLDVTLSQGQAWSFPGYPTVTEVKDAEHPTFKISFNWTEDALSVLKSGTYTLSIGEGSFKLDGGQPSPMISQRYSYKSDKPVDWNLVKSPNADDVVIMYNEWDEYYFVEVGLYIPETESYSAGANSSAIKIELDGVALEKGAAGETATYSQGYSSDSSVLYFDIMKTTEFTGVLKLTIPAGAIKLSGEPNAEDLVYTWNVVSPKEYTYTLTPDGKEPVDSLDEFTLAFPEAKTAELWARGYVSLTVKSNPYSDFGMLQFLDAEEVKDAECPTFKLLFKTSNAKDGEIYTLTLDAGAFALDGTQESPEIEQAYTYKKGSGMTLIPADADGKYTVYTLDGKVILDKASAAALLNLEKGIYIINGKKIAIK